MLKKTIFLFISILVVTACSQAKKASNDATTLKDAFKDDFLIGVAINSDQVAGADSVGQRLVLKQFNSLVAENCMKSEVIQPEKGKFDFKLADEFVNFGVKHHFHIVGHTLVWHSQAPKWFFVDDNGNPVSRDTLIQRMKTHIFTVMQRYKGKVNGWDVVNEAINDDGSWRESPFYKIIGKDYVKLAFQFAHEADPNVELYYNDYSMAKPGRRASVVKMIKELKNEGIRVDAIGMQGHFTMDFPSVEELEKSINAFAATGCKVMVTEMDYSVIPFPSGSVTADVGFKAQYDPKLNPYPNGLPDSIAKIQRERYNAFFKIFLKHRDVISRVTVWGASDKNSWRNDWPIKGRSDYPLLFDRNYQPKPIVEDLIKLATLSTPKEKNRDTVQ